MPSPPSVQTLAARVLGRERRALAKAITLLESTLPGDRQRADELLGLLLPHTGGALRLGISGVPGVGKSTFIEAFGMHLVGLGHRVAVLAVDPSSSLSGGSILGDKTRMERLAACEDAFIRPSPSGGTLGGVAARTREAMLLCEAAGHDVVLVETVGVGQSETTVAGMTDLFCLLQLPNAGDDLQAIKRGVMELADLVVIHKADLDAVAALRAKAQIVSGLRVATQQGNPMHAAVDGPSRNERVVLVSSVTGEGLPAFWDIVCQCEKHAQARGSWQARRQEQALAWMWDTIHHELRERFTRHVKVQQALPETIEEVRAGRLAASSAARHLLHLSDTRT